MTDPAAIHTDDELIDALCAARLGEDTELVFRLAAAWRNEVHAQAMPELVGVETALAVIRRARLA